MSDDYGWDGDAFIGDPELATLLGMTPATESLGPMMCDSPAAIIPSTFVIERGGAFHLTMTAWDAGNVAGSGNISMSLVTWLYLLPDDVTVYVYYGDQTSEMSTDLPFLACFLMMLVALKNTRANTVFVLDRPVGDIGAYAALACKTLAVTEIGMLSMQPITHLAAPAPGSFDQAVRPYIQLLLTHAAERTVLTEEEAEKLAQNEALYLLPHELLARAEASAVSTFTIFALNA